MPIHGVLSQGLHSVPEDTHSAFLPGNQRRRRKTARWTQEPHYFATSPPHPAPEPPATNWAPLLPSRLGGGDEDMVRGIGG